MYLISLRELILSYNILLYNIMLYWKNGSNFHTPIEERSGSDWLTTCTRKSKTVGSIPAASCV